MKATQNKTKRTVPSKQATQKQGPQQASPQEQEQYDDFVNNAYKIIYDNGLLMSFLKRIRHFVALGLGNEGLAQMLVQITNALITDLKDNHLKLGDGVIYHASAEILAELGQIAERHQIYSFSQSDLDMAFFRALDLFLESHNGKLPMSDEQARKDQAFIQDLDDRNAWDDYTPGLGAIIRDQLHGLGQPHGKAPHAQPIKEA